MEVYRLNFQKLETRNQMVTKQGLRNYNFLTTSLHSLINSMLMVLKGKNAYVTRFSSIYIKSLLLAISLNLLTFDLNCNSRDICIITVLCYLCGLFSVGRSTMPCQLMVGFFAYAKSLDIKLDKAELEGILTNVLIIICLGSGSNLSI